MKKNYLVLTVFLLAGSGIFAQAKLPELKPTRVAIFKNGIYFIKKESEVEVANRQFRFEPPGNVLMGTFWLSVGKNAEFRSASVFTDSFQYMRPVADMEDVLLNSKGKNITIRRKPFGSNSATRENTGVVVDYNATTHFLKMQQADGKLLLTKLDDLEELVGDAATAGEIKASGIRNVAKVNLAQDVARTTVTTLALQTGMTWMPSYFFRVVNDKEARLEMKATIENGGPALKQLPVDLVVGNPGLFYGTALDPISESKLEDLLDDEKPRYNTLNNYTTLNTNTVSQSVSLSGSAYNWSAGEEESETEGEKSQDLYYFKLGVMDLERDSKTIVPLFAQNIAYKDVYEVMIPATTLDEYTIAQVQADEKPLDVFHSFRFTNNSKTPYTTGAIFVVDDKENPLSQDELKYTPPGAEAVIKLSKAIDVQVKNEEEVVSMAMNFRKQNKVTYNKAVMKGQIRLTNFQQKKIKVSILKLIVGETDTLSHNGTAVKLKIAQNELNPTSRANWEVELNPGERQTVTYTYSILVK